MMPGARSQPIELIAIAQIRVLNPRTRNARQHKEIVENIRAIGLKRPITVRRHQGDDSRYDLVCGEGRLQACKMLGATEVPAVVIDADESDCLVMSLVENIARRKHKPIEMMHEIAGLSRRGYGAGEIAAKTGCSASWVQMVLQLVERGEERLLAAVETGLIPIRFALDIARAEGEESQAVLLEAYESGQLKGRKIGAIRRLLDQRLRRKDSSSGGSGRKSERRRITAADLMRLYQQESEKQRVLVKKAEFTQAKLLFLVEALKDLLADPGFGALLHEEKLTTMPRALAARLNGEAWA